MQFNKKSNDVNKWNVHKKSEKVSEISSLIESSNIFDIVDILSFFIITWRISVKNIVYFIDIIWKKISVNFLNYYIFIDELSFKVWNNWEKVFPNPELFLNSVLIKYILNNVDHSIDFSNLPDSLIDLINKKWINVDEKWKPEEYLQASVEYADKEWTNSKNDVVLQAKSSLFSNLIQSYDRKFINFLNAIFRPFNDALNNNEDSFNTDKPILWKAWFTAFLYRYKYNYRKFFSEVFSMFSEWESIIYKWKVYRINWSKNGVIFLSDLNSLDITISSNDTDPKDIVLLYIYKKNWSLPLILENYTNNSFLIDIV